MAKPLYVLRFWAWGRISATAQRHALEREKKNGYTAASDGENLHVLEFFAVGNKGKAVLFYSVKGSVRCSIIKFGSFFNMLICACSTTVILPLAYMHACHAVPRRKWNKAETNSNERTIVKFSLWPLRLARPRECVWARRFCGRVRGSGRK